MESSNNIMETLTIEQQSQVFDMMAVTNIQDTEVAAKLFRDSNFNMNVAVQRWLDRSLEGNRPVPTQNSGTAQQIRPQESELHRKYKTFLEDQTKKEEQKGISGSVQTGVNTMMFGVKSMWNSFVPTSIRGETLGGEQFALYLKKVSSDFKNLKFNFGTFSENIWQIKDTGRPLLVYFHVPTQENNKILLNLFKNKNVVDFLNTKFYLLGLIADTEEAKKTEEFVEPQNYPCVAAFRLNLVDEINLIEIINVNAETTAQQFLDKLQGANRAFWLKRAEEDRVKQEVKRQIDNERRGQMGGNLLFSDDNFIRQNENSGSMFPFFDGNANPNPNPQPQIRPEEQARIEQDRILRQIQDEEFKEVERRILEQEQQEKNKKEQVEKDKTDKIQKEEEEKRKLEEKKQLKELKLQNLPNEPAANEVGVIVIILRQPNGERIERRFKNTDKVQILYDFVDTRDIEFDKSTVRYDLIQPMPFLCLEDKEKTLNDYFEGSEYEIIHIREMHE